MGRGGARGGGGRTPGIDAEEARPGGAKSDDTLIAAILEKLGIDAWVAELTQDYGAHLSRRIAKAVQDAALSRAGLGTEPADAGRACDRRLGRPARRRLIDLDKQTRDALFEALAEGRAEGEVCNGARQPHRHPCRGGGPWNAGRTRRGSSRGPRRSMPRTSRRSRRQLAAGVTQFVVFDGRLGQAARCPSTSRDGSIVGAEEAVTMAETEHPNGTLSFAPYFEE